ncbi:alpha/beta hydrolase [Shewanella surugensis]|uniref:Alpha/beta hydrolase n=1 Tax=Shewanella surugensis TaxID=212020 RepID=A0ABT0LGN1_9GAMM|nr:alpha/beta hydrolase [Shewanella surugensis]MCL1126699.1 alpha/beta hydrolase [Shewanella surugensis]
MSSLRFIAGPTAFNTILEKGLQADTFSQVFAASGGPKWLGIAELDRYLFGEFFKHRTSPLYTIGASSGAWRLASLAQENPVEAHKRLETLYINQIYEGKPTPAFITQKISSIIHDLLGDNKGDDIISHPIIKSHFVTCRARHLNGRDNRMALAAGLAATAVSNLVSRKSLGWHFERCVFGVDDDASPFCELRDLPSRHIALHKENISKVLVASGAIPWVLAPVSNIKGAPKGKYFDGGITDYHFDLNLTKPKGMTIYPHFSPIMKPGWFDKSLAWRQARHNYDNALILAPTEKFINSLPLSKLPDRRDFKSLETQKRIQYWKNATAMSQALANDLDKVINDGTIANKLERL